MMAEGIEAAPWQPGLDASPTIGGDARCSPACSGHIYDVQCAPCAGWGLGRLWRFLDSAGAETSTSSNGGRRGVR